MLASRRLGLALRLFEGNKLYEGMFLFDSNLAMKDWPGLEKHVHEILQKNQAELVYSERWPDRKLCYDIKGAKKGTYYLTYFRAPPNAVKGVQHDSELSERILRLLVLYDRELQKDCDQRVNREVTGSPEEIEERRERLRRDAETQGASSETTSLAAADASPPSAPGDASNGAS
jgi:small subunit ribosomal protein S6